MLGQAHSATKTSVRFYKLSICTVKCLEKNKPLSSIPLFSNASFPCTTQIHKRVRILCFSRHVYFLCRYIPEGLQCSCGPDWYTTNNKYNNESYVMFLFCFCFAVPFGTMVFCYSNLLYTMKMVSRKPPFV